MASVSEGEEHYDFDEDRELNVLTIDEINDRILPAVAVLSGFACVECLWLSNPEGAFWVNRVYRLKLKQRDGQVDGNDKHEQLVVLKVGHPLWNRTGKCGNEARALRFLEQRFPDIPAPRVLGYRSPRDESVCALSASSRAAQRQRWLQARTTEERKRDTVAECEWLLMGFVEGSNLGKLWDKLDWPARQHWIRQLVGHLAPLSKHRFAHTGAFISDDFAVGPDFEWEDKSSEVERVAMEGKSPAGPFTQWNELSLLYVKAAIALVKDKLSATTAHSDQQQLLQTKAKLLDALAAHLTHECFADVPICFCLRDVAPKNILVDEAAGRITAVLDLEWAGPFWQGEDISEMDYPMTEADLAEARPSNESFTDSSELPYAEQSAFVRAEWRSHGVNPILLDERATLASIACDLKHDLFGSDEQQLLDRLQRCLATCHRCVVVDIQ